MGPRSPNGRSCHKCGTMDDPRGPVCADADNPSGTVGIGDQLRNLLHAHLGLGLRRAGFLGKNLE